MTELDDLEARLAVGAAPGAFDAGRCLVEAAWVPTALLPRFGVTWTATDQHHLVAHQRVADAELDVEHEIDDELVGGGVLPPRDHRVAARALSAHAAHSGSDSGSDCAASASRSRFLRAGPNP